MPKKYAILYVGDGKGHGARISRASPDRPDGPRYQFERGHVTEVPKALHALLMTEGGFEDAGGPQAKAEAED
jgi:hypothetical protein